MHCKKLEGSGSEIEFAQIRIRLSLVRVRESNNVVQAVNQTLFSKLGNKRNVWGCWTEIKLRKTSSNMFYETMPQRVRPEKWANDMFAQRSTPLRQNLKLTLKKFVFRVRFLKSFSFWCTPLGTNIVGSIFTRCYLNLHWQSHTREPCGEAESFRSLQFILNGAMHQ